MNSFALELVDFRMWRFAMAGVANTVVGLSVIFACKAILDLGDVAANFIGYSTALLVSFVLHKHWTFEYRGDAASALGRYLVVRAVAYLANLYVTIYAIDVLHMGSYWAQAAGVVPYGITGYLGSRLFAFAERGKHE